MPDSLKEQRVLIVGASSGMGRETAILFAREGAKVMACARRENRLAALRREMEAEDREIGICAADASDPDAMERAAQVAVDQFGGIDVLVYATGTNTPDRALTRLNPEIWKMMLDVNLNGAYYATRAVLPGMRARQSGLIFYISSRSAVIPDESGAADQAAKRGLAGLAQAIRVEERENGIRT
ncbi:MAG TPA: SDR family oxidoreductase, partial [Bryobacteraceae bacterium]|nr:SDR family oxidoreductase [Bryobacteraceae bacterium]